jgi:hypothetical protein
VVRDRRSRDGLCRKGFGADGLDGLKNQGVVLSRKILEKKERK